MTGDIFKPESIKLQKRWKDGSVMQTKKFPVEPPVLHMHLESIIRDKYDARRLLDCCYQVHDRKHSVNVFPN